MEPKDLLKVWDAPDHSRLIPKQVSIRLPILVAAKIAALQEMYPSKSKSQIIVDLLATALDQLESGLPSKRGVLIEEMPEEPMDPDLLHAGPFGEQEINLKTVRIYEDAGLRGHFLRLTKNHLRDMEKELGVEEPMRLPSPVIIGDEEE